MPNRYSDELATYTGQSILSGMATGATTGATLGTVFGTLGSFIGAGLGAIAGILGSAIGISGRINEYRNTRDSLLNDRMEVTVTRNNLILDAQRSISGFRTDFDNIYGKGAYDAYDELFNNIFSMPSGSMSVSDLLESLSTDQLSGDITTAVGGKLSEAALNGTLSAQDINSAYLEYIAEQIRSADTSIGLQFEAQSYRENAMISDYYDSIDQYNLQMSLQFYNAFMRQRSANLENASALGEAETMQATSGIRQIGGGANSSIVQKFQNDLSEAAYYSTLGYALKQYQGQMDTANNNLINEVYTIRNENAQMSEEILNEYFSSMNKYYGQLINSFYRPIADAEGSITEINEEIEDINAVIGDGKNNSMFEEVDYF